MSLSLKNHKGSILITSIIVGLLAVGAIAFLIYTFISKLYEMHTVTLEYETERHAINLANVLMSSDKLAYEQNGKIYRGILNASKLNDTMYNRSEFLSDISGKLKKLKDIGIGYPNSYMIVEVIDLNTCKKNNECDGWVVSLKGPNTLGINTKEFVNCLGSKITQQNTITETWFKWFTLPGQMLNLFPPFGDINECARKVELPSVKEFFFSSSLITRIGLPVDVWYPNGTIHAGRIIVGVAEWH